MVLTLSAEHLILAYDQGGSLISLFAAHNLNSPDQKTLCLPFLPLHYLFSLFYEKNSMWMYREIMCIGRQAMVRVFFLLHSWQQVCLSHAMPCARCDIVAWKP